MSTTTKYSEGPWLFEPHGAFRSNIDGEEWPFGYLSAGPGRPIFALHDVIGDLPVPELLSAANIAAAAPELYAVATSVEELFRDLTGKVDEAFLDRFASVCFAARAALAKADVA